MDFSHLLTIGNALIGFIFAIIGFVFRVIWTKVEDTETKANANKINIGHIDKRLVNVESIARLVENDLSAIKERTGNIVEYQKRMEAMLLRQEREK